MRRTPLLARPARRYDSRRDRTGGGDRGRGQPEISLVQRSHNSHQLKKRAFRFTARLRREKPFHTADDAAWYAAAERIAGAPDRWYSWAGWAPADVGFTLIGFATRAEAEKQCRIVFPRLRNPPSRSNIRAAWRWT